MKKSAEILLLSATLTGGLLFASQETAFAHCDTHEGPVVADAQKALAENNFNYIAKWVLPEDEAELQETFDEVMTVRDDSPDAQELADKYLYQNLVRIHRAGEGAPYTGIKPPGTPVEPEIAAADESIATESLTPFDGVIPDDKIPELAESFQKVLDTKDFEVNDVEAGREYVEAYVKFTHLAEAINGGEHTEEEAVTEEHAAEEAAATSQEETTTKENPLVAWFKALLGMD